MVCKRFSSWSSLLKHSNVGPALPSIIIFLLVISSNVVLILLLWSWSCSSSSKTPNPYHHDVDHVCYLLHLVPHAWFILVVIDSWFLLVLIGSWPRMCSPFFTFSFLVFKVCPYSQSWSCSSSFGSWFLVPFSFPESWSWSCSSSFGSSLFILVFSFWFLLVHDCHRVLSSSWFLAPSSS